VTWLGWIVTGFIAGGLARMATGSSKRGCLGTIAVGVLGALLGGYLFTAVGQRGIGEFDLWSIFVAFIGASLLLLVLNLFSGRPRHDDRDARGRRY
jgi:uncharacterized membrane protein YeaQ/YmgE (transglycosylase-associated protein family)